jgi:amino acid adenylation domain-containing protein
MKPKNVEDVYELSPIQQGLLFHSLYVPDSGVYVQQNEWLLRGEINLKAFEHAWQQAVNRHSTLRTCFVWKDLDKPLQVVRQSVKLRIAIEDWSELSDSEQQPRLLDFLAADRRRGFELSRAPLLRLALLRLDDEQHRLIWSNHHLLLDGWSIPLLLKEVFILYQGLCRNEPVQLAQPRPYRDYIFWLQSQSLEEAERYWREQLRGLTSPTTLALGRGAVARAGERGERAEGEHGEQWLKLTAAETAELNAAARRHKLTLNTIAQGAWSILLSRYSGEQDVVFGTTVAGRPAELRGVEQMVGLFINTLPMRVRINERERVSEWLSGLQAELIKMRQYEYSPLIEVAKWSEMPRGIPLFESVLAFENYPTDASFAEQIKQSTGLEVLEFKVHERGNHSLTVEVYPAKQELRVKIEYEREHFDDKTISRMLGHFQQLLRAIVADPQQRVGDLSLLTDSERQQLLVEWNDTTREFANEACLQELFEAQVSRTPNAIALSYEDTNLTYQELNERSNQLAHYLSTLGVGPEVCVGVCLERSVDLVVALVAILKAGGAYVPLDSSYPLERLAFMLEDAQIGILVTTEKQLDVLPAHWALTICLDTDAEMIAGLSEENLGSAVSAENLAYVMYTSGSTGQPKGVSVMHRSVVRLVQETNYLDVSERDVFLQAAPISFDASTLEVWGSLLNGARLVLLEPQRPTLEELARTISGNGVTVLWLTAGLFHLMVAEQGEQLRSVRRLLAGGDVLAGEQVRKHLAQMGPEDRLINGYGPTENTTFTCCHPMTRESRWEGTVPIGKPIANTTVYVLDQQQRVVPVGVYGEIYAGGDGLARGYLHSPELTAEKFVPHPFSASGGERLYRTGDVGRWLGNGSIEFLGRVDEQVKLRGFRIELGEIEAVLSRHAAVREAVVVVQEVNQDKRLVAYVVSAGEPEVSSTELRSYLREQLPAYMVPAFFVTLAELPLTPHGKVDRRALPAPERTRAQSEGSYVAARTPVEELLATIWCEVLGLEQVGVHDNFFHLGGDSIRIIQVGAQAQKFGLEFSIVQLFEHKTIAALAQVLSASADGPFTAAQTQPFSLLTEADRQLLPAEIVDAYPLAQLQAGMLFHSQYSRESAIYHDLFSFHLEVPLQVEALQQAIDRLIARHPVLRTGFDLHHYSEPLQLVHEQVAVRLQVQDLRGLQPEEQERQLAQCIESEKHHHLDLTQVPLLRFQVYRRSKQTFQFTLSFHHAILDGWSVATMLTELFRSYLSIVEGLERAEEKPPASTFREFVWLERESVKSEETQEYWRERLADANFVKVPLRNAALAEHNAAPQAASLEVPISLGLTDDLKKVGRLARVPLKSVLLAAHLRMMSLLSGQADVTTGLVTNGRVEEIDGERVLGLFLNTLPLRLKLDGGSWLELARQTFAAEKELMPHRRYPMVQLQRMLSGQPLFETAFNYTNFHVYETLKDIQGVHVLGLDVFEQTNFTLVVNFSMDTSQLKLRLDYNASQVPAEDVKLFSDYFAKVLALMTAEPASSYTSQSLLSKHERHQLLTEWNETAVEYPQEQCIHELFEQQVARTPEQVAMVFEEEEVSYRELNERANQLAHHLRSLGVGAESLVGILLERSVEMVVALLGVLKAGGAYVPLDPAYPRQRLSLMLEDSQLAILLTQQHLRAQLPTENLQVVCLDSDWTGISSSSAADLSSLAAPTNLAYVIYTSGSTGRPKGVQITHGAVVNFLTSMQQAPGISADILLSVTTLSFDIAGLEIYLPLLNGARLVLASRETALDGSQLARLIESSQATVMQATPATWRLLLEAEWAGSKQLKLLCGGEALPGELAGRLLEHGASLWNLYGPTETTIWSALKQVETVNRGVVEIGRPIANTQLYVLDRSLQPVPQGVAGELFIGGAGLARGYLKRAELTAERFIPDPFSQTAGARLYRTGDRTRYLPDGQLEFLGRVDHQVKVRGYRVELGEVEAALRRHERVRDCVVVAREEVEDDKRLVAYVVDGDGPGLDAGELRRVLKERLPEHMVPSLFVLIEELPLTPNGKVDRQALPAPNRTETVGASGYVAPQTPVEEILAGIWAGVLRVGRVGVNDNLFELGGHSLLAMQIISRVREAFGVDLTIQSLFESPTVGEFAYRVEEDMKDQQTAPSSPMQSVARDADLWLSFAQQRLWFLDQWEPSSPFYNSPTALRLSGRFDVPVLQRTLFEVVRRHEVLRTSFPSVNGQPQQRIVERWEPPLPVIDLSALDQVVGEEMAKWLAQREALQPFNLATGPLLRATLLRLSAEEHVLLFTMHHIVSDAWSMGLLVREVAALYRAYQEGQESPLEELAVQYADYAVWQREWLGGEVLEGQLEYWRRQLAGSPAVLALPTDRPRPKVQSFRGASSQFRLSAELTAGLKELSRRSGVTLFMTLLAGFALLLWRLSGQEDICVGTAIANRTRRETEGLIGFFVNTVVLRTELSGEMSSRQLLGRVREVCLGAYGHQEVPFERLVEELRPERSLSHSPLFQVAFGLDNAPREELELPGLKLSGMELEDEVVRFDLTLWMLEAAGELSGRWTYRTELFDAERVERMSRQLERLLESMVANPEARIETLEMYSEAEKEQKAIEGKVRSQANYQKLKGVKPKPIRRAG